MYIEFRLPTVGGSGGAQHTNWMILQKLNEWAEKYGVRYRKKNIKYCLRITFDDEQLYSLFAMTWNTVDRKNRFQFSLVETLNLDKY